MPAFFLFSSSPVVDEGKARAVFLLTLTKSPKLLEMPLVKTTSFFCIFLPVLVLVLCCLCICFDFDFGFGFLFLFDLDGGST